MPTESRRAREASRELIFARVMTLAMDISRECVQCGQNAHQELVQFRRMPGVNQRMEMRQTIQHGQGVAVSLLRVFDISRSVGIIDAVDPH